jgi:type I restriction enzyme, S subunit
MAGIKELSVPLPPRAAQERIVAAIEEHLSHLDAAEVALRSARARLAHARVSVAEALIESSGPLAPMIQFAAANKNSMAIGPFGSNLKVSDYRDDGVPLVFVRDIRRGRFGGEATRYVSHEKAAELSSHIGVDKLWNYCNILRDDGCRTATTSSSSPTCCS